MANNIKGITVEIGGNTGPLDKALKDVNKTSRSLQGELREVNRQLKLDPTNTTLLTQRQRLLAESVANTRNKLETLKEAERQAQVQFREGRISEEQYRALQREVIRTEQQLIGLERQAIRSNSVLNRISETVGKVGDSAGKIGNKMMPATAAITAAGAAASKFSIDFENSVAKASTIANESEVSIGDLRKGILKLSDDTGIAATEIANNVYDAISAGQKTGDAINFVSSSTKLAKAGFAEAGQSLDLLTTIMNAYGMEAKEVTTVSDILINTQNLGKTTVGELSSSMGKVIPTAKAFGVNLQQVASGYAIMTAKGIKSAETTTYMAGMFNELGKSGTKASDVVKKVSGKSFQKLIKSGKSVGDVLNLMNEYAKKNNLSLADLFGSAEAGKAALILSANAGKDFNEMLKSMNNTAGKTDEAFKKVSNTTGEKLKKSLNQFKNDAIKLGDSIAPIIQKISNLAGILAKKLGALSKEQLDTLVKVGLIVAAIGPLAKLIKGITTIVGVLTTGIGAITGAVGLLTGSLTVATPAATALAGAITFITGPIGLTILGITSLVAGFTYLWKHCTGFKNFWIGLWSGIKQTTITAVNVIVRLFTTTIPNEWHSLMNCLKGIPAWFNQLWNNVKTNTENIWNGIKDFFKSLWQDIKNIFNTAIEGICNFVMNKFGFVVDGAIGIWDGFSQYIGGVWKIIKNIFLGSLLLILDIVTGNFDKLKTDCMQIWENIKQGFSHIWSGITQIFSTALELVKQVVTNAWTNITTTTSNIWNGIKNFLSNLWTNLKILCSNSWNSIKTTTVTIWNGILSWFTTLPSRLYNCAVNMFTSMKNGVVNTGHSISEGAKTIGRNIITAFKELPGQMLEIGKNIVQGLINGIKNFAANAWEAAKGLATGLADKVRNVLDIHSPSRVMVEIGKFITQGLALGIENNKHLAVKASEDLANAVITSTNKIKESTFQDKLGHLLNWGSTEKEPYQDATNFINKLNNEQLEHSKSVLDKEYKFRVENVKNDLKNAKESNAKKLDLEKNRVNSQIAYYQNMQKNTKNKNTKSFYANKIETLKQYLKQYESTIKATQDLTIKKLEVSKNALEKYYAEAKELLKNREDNLKEFMSTTSNFASKLKEALKQNIDEVQKKEEEAIKENIDLNDKWKEKTLKAYSYVHKTKLENLEDEYKKFEKNINAETKLLDEKLKKFDSEKADTDDSKKEKELRRILSMNYSKKKKVEAQKELNALIKSRDERHYKESIEQQKEALKEKLDNKKESIEESKKALNKQYEQDKENTEKIYKNNKEMYDNQLDYTKRYYAEQKKEANINARVQKMIIENNNKEIISLLKSTGKEYELTGATLADRFANAFIDNLSVVKDAIADITSQLNNLNTNIVTSNIPRLSTLGGYSTSNINNTNVKNKYGSILHADKIVLNGNKDTQSFAEELEFYRQQAAKAKGGR
ncbi:phage tail tape measure protein [Clostridium botulinum]|uniref:phage tail tape measure protein n=1 Tax=Clostridium botulinum TaxID=1491 RepID=UPI0004D4C2E7|nr:phage tail tape measure protein [Clostridium botulinum]KEI01563.1 hypothetical protein Z952_11970 [Clostridium botulinum C/D str. BKT75002]KEI07897.1 hypothetical protein Z954_03105 [Clostridium botulinum C/D str. BKT2873]